MGGHSAWVKRVESGELAKKSGGAICRHRPHLGRKGKEELLLNRKGHILGGPKKKKKRANLLPSVDEQLYGGAEEGDVESKGKKSITDLFPFFVSVTEITASSYKRFGFCLFSLVILLIWRISFRSLQCLTHK